ncbi:hypothetical protein [Sphingomonas bacterium]|uniref:hypothetical protein n=1 Tax=Sphingomonas bacterium TaxID=1895847 RepID=UPI0015764848|nr:hypothetical protein [Sphingomonas bacterium]
MFLDHNGWPPPEPWRPKPPRRRITVRQERMIAWIIGFNLLMLLLGPLAGATVFEGVVALLRH